MLNKKKLKIAIHGALYGRNFGDILITEILIKSLSTKYDISLPYSLDRFRKLLNVKTVKKLDVKKTDLLIFGPGGYLGQPDKNLLRWNIRFFFYHGTAIILAKLFNIKTIIYGTGIGPITNKINKKLLGILINNCNYINVRDFESYKYIKNNFEIKLNSKFTYSVDIAFALRNIYKININIAKNNKIALHFPLKESSKNISLIKDDLKILLEKNQNLKFTFIFDGPNQILPSIFNELLLLSNVDIIYFNSVKDLLITLSTHDVIITTKLHVGICGYVMNKKIISIYSHSKNIRFFKQIDMTEYIISINKYPSNWLNNSFDKIMTNSTYNSKLRVLSNISDKSCVELRNYLNQL